MALEKIATDEAVFAAADSIAAEGGKVTVRAVWKAVGGSLTTVAPALRRWREDQELKAEQPTERAPLPEAIADAMHAATAQLWKAAQDATQSELDALTRTMNDRIEKAGAERDDALGELQAAVEELDQVRAQLADAEAAIETAGQRIEQQEEAARTLRAELDVARAALAVEQARTAELEGRTADLKNELSHAHSAADALRVEHDTTKAAAAAAAVESAAALRTLSDDVLLARSTAERAESALAYVREELGRAQSERNEAIKSAEGLRTELAASREVAARQAGELDALRVLVARIMPDKEGGAPRTQKTEKPTKRDV